MKMNNNLAKLSRSGTPKAKKDQKPKGGGWVISVVMAILLIFVVAFIVTLYFVIESLNLPIAITVIIGIVTFIAWVILGAMLGNYVRGLWWGDN